MRERAHIPQHNHRNYEYHETGRVGLLAVTPVFIRDPSAVYARPRLSKYLIKSTEVEENEVYADA